MAEMTTAPNPTVPDLRSNDGTDLRALSADATPFDLVAHLERQRAFSAKTFGPGARTAGVVDHIRKELCEIEADPADISEWVDVVILAFDGAWRAGWEPAEIVKAIVAKQTKNEARTWPDWRTADPNKAIEHDRSGETRPGAKLAAPATVSDKAVIAACKSFFGASWDFIDAETMRLALEAARLASRAVHFVPIDFGGGWLVYDLLTDTRIGCGGHGFFETKEAAQEHCNRVMLALAAAPQHNAEGA